MDYGVGQQNKGGENVKKFYVSLLTLCFIVIFLTTAAHATAVLEMRVTDPTGQTQLTDEITIKVCENFTLDFVLTGAQADLDKYGGGLSYFAHALVLDPLVEVVNVHVKDPFIDSYAGVITITNNRLEMGGYNFIPGGVRQDEIPLVNVTLHCIGVGETYLTQEFFSPHGDNFYLDTPTFTDFLDPDIVFEPVTIKVNQVPIPGAFILLGSGLLGLIGIKKKKIFG